MNPSLQYVEVALFASLHTVGMVFVCFNKRGPLVLNIRFIPIDKSTRVCRCGACVCIKSVKKVFAVKMGM